MLYVDSNVFIYPVIYDPSSVEEARRSRRFLVRIASGEVKACTSVLTWDEVSWVVRRVLGVEPSLKLSRLFLTFPNLKLLSVKELTILRAQELMERYKIKPRDAIHIATALENGVLTLVSYDRDFDVVGDIRRVEP